jgi:hypothetical protein
LTGQPSWHSILHWSQSTPTSAVWNLSGIAFSEITAWQSLLQGGFQQQTMR